jgi:hypothetical protein
VTNPAPNPTQENMHYKNKYTFFNSATKLTVVIHALCQVNADQKLCNELGVKSLSADWKLTKIEVRK